MNRSNLGQAAGDLFVLFGAVTLFGLVTTPGNPFLVGLAFHPYHIIVLLMAARYGTSMALTASSLLIGVYELGGLAVAAERTLPSLLQEPHSVFAAGAILIAVVAGNHYDRLQIKILKIEKARKELDGQVLVLRQNNQVLESANRDLRGRILEETTTFQTMYEMAEKLSTLEPQYLYPAVLDILVQHLGVKRCSFYVLEDRMLRLVAEKGWDSVPEEERLLPLDRGVFAQVLREKKPVTIKDLLFKNERTQGEKIMAAPVSVEGTGEIGGIIAVEAMPFDKFNSQTVRAFGLVAEWASKAMANVEIFSKSEREKQELDSKAKTEEMERQWMFARMLKQLDAKDLPDMTIRQITSLGPAVLPKLEELLLNPDARLIAKKNALTVLERFMEQGHRLDSGTYRSFTLECLRDWFRLERDRVASREPNCREAGESLCLCIEEHQVLLRGCLMRGLVLRLGRGAELSPKMLDAIREQLAEVDPLVHELLSALEAGHGARIEALAKKRWGFAPVRFEEVTAELVSSHDPWLKATAIHAAGILGHVSCRPQIQKAVCDENPIVRETAILGLIKLNEVEPDPDLKPLLDGRSASERDRFVREIARNWVAQWDPGTRGAHGR